MKVSSRRVGLSSSLVPSPEHVVRVVKTVFSFERARPRGDVNVIFVDNKTIRTLNKRFLDEPGNTDVIAFPYEPPPGRVRDAVFGDIYISVPVARENARRFEEEAGREVTRLIVHGVLHLLGYTDKKAALRKRMWSRQEALVERLSRPSRARLPEKKIK